MKKLIAIILLVFTFWLNSTSASFDNNEILDSKINQIKNNIWDNWELYKIKVIDRLFRYKNEFAKDINKLEIADYILSQIKNITIEYWKTISATPILNTGSFNYYFYWTWSWPILDDYEQIDPVESILFRWSSIIIKDTIDDWANKIYVIKTNEIPYSWDFFIDSRFVLKYTNKPEDRTTILPTKDEIISNLKSQVGYDYIRWWVIPGWIKELEEYYKPKIELEKKTRNRLILNWFDCSWLLYYVTNWYTPRNTSKLVNFGTWVDIFWLTKNEIITKLKPLDIITWKWHVMIIIDKNNLIESRLDYNIESPWYDWWVRISSLDAVIDDLVKNKIGVNSYDTEVPDGKKKFVIRRWYWE